MVQRVTTSETNSVLGDVSSLSLLTSFYSKSMFNEEYEHGKLKKRINITKELNAAWFGDSQHKVAA